MMGRMSDPQAFLYSAFTGPHLDVMGGRLRILYDGSLNGGRHSCATGEYDPGAMVPPHTHILADETFYIVQGEFEFWKDGGWKAVAAGDVVFAQRGVMHGFRNVGSSLGRLVATYSPAGFEQLLIEVDAQARAGTLTDATLEEIAGRYEVVTLPPDEWADA